MYGEYLFALMPIGYGAGLYFLMKGSIPELFSARTPARETV